MDKKSQSVRFGLCLIGNVSLNSLISKGVLIATLATEPVSQNWNYFFNVFISENETWIIFNAPTLIKVGGINKMPF